MSEREVIPAAGALVSIALTLLAYWLGKRSARGDRPSCPHAPCPLLSGTPQVVVDVEVVRRALVAFDRMREHAVTLGGDPGELEQIGDELKRAAKSYPKSFPVPHEFRGLPRKDDFK